jgi:hypothetical protein
MLQKKQQLRGSNMSRGGPGKLVAQAGEIARLEEDKNQRTEAYNHQLSEQLDLLDALDQRAHILADTPGRRLRPPGRGDRRAAHRLHRLCQAAGGLQERLTAQMLAAAKDRIAQERARPQFRSRLRDGRDAAHYAASLSGAKGLFRSQKQRLQDPDGLEQRSIRPSSLPTRSRRSCSTQSTRPRRSPMRSRAASANAAAGAAKIFAELGPWASPSSRRWWRRSRRWA